MAEETVVQRTSATNQDDVQAKHSALRQIRWTSS